MPTNPLLRHPDTKTDRQLLEEAGQGCGASFEVVYRRHHAVVLTFLAKRAGQPELAADLMSETFAALLVLVNKPEQPLPPCPSLGWWSQLGIF